MYSTFFTNLHFHFNNTLFLYLNIYELKLTLVYLLYFQLKHLGKSPCSDFYKYFFKCEKIPVMLQMDLLHMFRFLKEGHTCKESSI